MHLDVSFCALSDRRRRKETPSPHLSNLHVCLLRSLIPRRELRLARASKGISAVPVVVDRVFRR